MGFEVVVAGLDVGAGVGVGFGVGIGVAFGIVVGVGFGVDTGAGLAQATIQYCQQSKCTQYAHYFVHPDLPGHIVLQPSDVHIIMTQMTCVNHLHSIINKIECPCGD